MVYKNNFNLHGCDKYLTINIPNQKLPFTPTKKSQHYNWFWHNCTNLEVE